MPNKRKQAIKDALMLPDSIKADAKTMGSIMNRWSKHAEDVTEEVFSWGKKHKFLVIFVVGITFFFKYLFDEKEKKEDEY